MNDVCMFTQSRTPNQTRSMPSLLATGGKQGEGYRFYELLDGQSDPTGTPRYSNPYCLISADAIASQSPCVMPATSARSLRDTC